MLLSTLVSTAVAGALAGMVSVPAGAYRPLYGAPNAPNAPNGETVAVAAFMIDRDPATRGDYLAFVRANPAWRRGAVDPRLADRALYLGDWRGDLDAGDATDLRRPATGISWHAARAYCAWRGKRLPTVHEWEYAAAASATRADAARDPQFMRVVLERYATRRHPLAPVTSGSVNLYGVRGLHDFSWEWTADYDGRTHASHAGHAHGSSGRDLSCAGSAVGATDTGNYPAFLRAAVRSGLTGRDASGALGVRCAA